MMMNRLKLNTKRGISVLRSWSSSFIQNNTILVFSNDLPIGLGETQRYDDDKISITVGIGTLQTSSPGCYRIIDNEDFVTIGTATFHELRHYERMTSDNGPKEIQISDLSKYNNRDYYEYNHDIMPHEIEVEYYGVMSMWNHLDILSPKYANELMFDHLTRRTTETIYSFPYPDGGFISREQVEDLFEDAYEKSLTSKRNLPPGYLKMTDEISMMLSDGTGFPRREYAQIYNDLVVNCTDEKMASLVSYLHPELQKFYPDVDFDKINPEHIFKCPILETPDEIKARIAEDLFSLGVSEISEDPGISPSL